MYGAGFCHLLGDLGADKLLARSRPQDRHPLPIETPVGPTEIRDFAEKIQAIGAQEGYFVAREFTAGTRARAAQDP